MREESKHKPRILIFTQYFYPDITAASFRMYELYKYFIRQGFEAEVVTTFPHKSDVKLVENDPQNIHRIKVHFASPKNKLKYIYYYLEFVLKSFFHILKNRLYDCDLIFVSSPPIFVAIEALFISQIFREKLYLDIRDLWPDTVVDVGKIKKNGFIYRVFKFFEINLYRKSSKVFCVSQPMRDYILQYKSDVAVVYNGISENDFIKFKEKPDVVHKCDAFKVFYTGNIGMAQTLDFVFDAAKELQDEGKININFYIIGEGVKLKDYQECAENYELKNVIFQKAMPREELLEYVYKNADILLLPLKEGFALEKTIPSKLFDYLLLKKPIIYHIYGEGRDILKRLEVGEEFELNSQSFLGALQKIVSNYDQYQTKAQRYNFILLKDFIRETQFKKIIGMPSFLEHL